MDFIGLFPLAIVLFPDSELPIHVYEDRYKKLVNKSMQDGSLFGINQISVNKFYEIGCAASISKILHKYEDGKFDIVVRGEKRFIVRDIVESDSSYWTGKIEYIADEDEIRNLDLMLSCIELYNEIANTIQIVNIPKISPNSLDIQYPSYLIAQKSGLNHEEKQKLLELRSENARLTFLSAHLQGIIPLLKEAEYINKIIKNDGYYNTRNLF
jgi:ATP-dependent Lon protease